MANKKKNKYQVKHKNNYAAREYLDVRSGNYDGGVSSNAFAVQGHPTGSQNSEMNEISMQLSRDVGAIPDYAVAAPSHYDAYDDYQGEGLGDLGGPELYGNKPSLLKKSPLNKTSGSIEESGFGLWSAVGLGVSALLAGVAAYALYKETATQIAKAQPKRRSQANARGRQIAQQRGLQAEYAEI